MKCPGTIVSHRIVQLHVTIYWNWTTRLAIGAVVALSRIEVVEEVMDVE